MLIKKANLERAVELVMPGLASKEVIEQSGSIIFKNGRICTYNDEVSVSHPFETDIEGAISGKKLLDFLKRSRDEELTIKLKKGVIEFKGKKNTAGIKMSEDVVLPIGEVGSAADWEELPEDFCKAIHFCMFSTGTDKSRPLLMCVHVSDDTAESCDNHRLTRYEMKGAVDTTLLVPSGVVRDLIKYNPTHVAKVKGWLHFKNDADTLFCCRTYDEDFPDVNNILEVNGAEAKWPVALRDVIDRVSIFSEGSGATGSRIGVVIGDGMIKVRGQGDHGFSEEEMRIRYKGSVSFEINPDFFNEILKHTDAAVIGDGKLRFEGDNWCHVLGLIAGGRQKKTEPPQQGNSFEEPTYNDDDEIPF